MLEKIKSLSEVSKEISEEIGEVKKFDASNGYYRANMRNRRDYELADTKIRSTLSFKGKKQPISFGYFKSKKGYNTKLKNNKEYANHYGEYIAYIILKQLGKKACKVDIGEMTIKNPYTNKDIPIEGILSHTQLSQAEIFKPINVVVEDYKARHSKKYRELTERGRTNSDKNYTNVEIVLEALEETLKNGKQESKIPEIRKSFFDMCIFDIKFANRDRHDENFGLKINQDTNEINFYHLFDNEQILGFQENKSDVTKYLSNDKEYQKFKKNQLTSCIGIPGKIQQIPSQELLRYLLENYYEEAMESLQDIQRYKLSDLQEIMGYFPKLSSEHKQLAKKIFTDRELEIKQTLDEYDKKQKLNTDNDEPSL